LGPASGSSQERSNRPVLTKLPPIKNCTEHIKLIKAELRDRDGWQVAALEVENQAYVGVVSIQVEQIVNRGKNSIVETGFTPDKPPLVIIPPGERKTLTIENLGPKSPIRIGAAMFSDGTEEGCPSSLKDMRESKEFHTKREGSQK
jgi:hypothetical protein